VTCIAFLCRPDTASEGTCHLWWVHFGKPFDIVSQRRWAEVSCRCFGGKKLDSFSPQSLAPLTSVIVSFLLVVSSRLHWSLREEEPRSSPKDSIVVMDRPKTESSLFHPGVLRNAREALIPFGEHPSMHDGSICGLFR
jgi:hypothetical protein